MNQRCFIVLAVLVQVVLTGQAQGLWPMKALEKAPQAVFCETNGVVCSLYYQSETFQGKPTRIFAYYARPQGPGPLPGIVLVHGGGGRAFSEWARHWAQRGYVALAMDLAGCGPDGNKLPDGGPGQEDTSKFKDLTQQTMQEMWTYQAVAAIIRGVSLLASRPEVDPDRIAITGISWGGYLTCIVAGLDHRLKAAVPVYGCGFLDHNSVWVPLFEQMRPEQKTIWVNCFDPSRYLCEVKCPILFINGTCDFAYPLDSYQKSYNLVRGRLMNLSVEINRPHGHIWTFPEVDVFVDSWLKDGKPLARANKTRVRNGILETKVITSVPIASAALNFTTNSGAWQKRVWLETPALVEGKTIKASLPQARPLTAYLRITDQRGLSVSCPHIELAAEPQHPASSQAVVNHHLYENRHAHPSAISHAH